MASLRYWGPGTRPTLDHIDPGNAGGSVMIPESRPLDADALTPRFICAQCSANFGSADALFSHRFSEHPLRRPVLILGGREVLTPTHVVRESLDAFSIAVHNTSRCWLNGKTFRSDELPEAVAALKSGFTAIRLQSPDGYVNADYELRVDIPKEQDVDEVETRFLELTKEGDLHRQTVERFIRRTRDADSAIGLVDALSHYLYAILAKDQRGDTQLSRDDARSRYNMALQGLEGFHRNLALVLTDVINFNHNAFRKGECLASVPALQIAMSRFYTLTTTELSDSTQAGAMTRRPDDGLAIPLDAATDQIVIWSQATGTDLLNWRGEMEVAFRTDTWTAEDRFKVRVLLALGFSAAGNAEMAAEHARRVRNNDSFSGWAESLIARSKGPT